MAEHDDDLAAQRAHREENAQRYEHAIATATELIVEAVREQYVEAGIDLHGPQVIELRTKARQVATYLADNGALII